MKTKFKNYTPCCISVRHLPARLRWVVGDTRHTAFAMSIDNQAVRYKKVNDFIFENAKNLNLYEPLLTFLNGAILRRYNVIERSEILPSAKQCVRTPVPPMAGALKRQKLSEKK